MVKRWEPGPVETIVRPGRADLIRVRWTNPVTRERPTYSKLVDETDGEAFRTWLMSKGGRVNKKTPELVQGTWRGDAETVFGDARITCGDFARQHIDARTTKHGEPIAPKTRRDLHGLWRNYFGPTLDDVRMIDVDGALVREVLAALKEPHEIVNPMSGTTRTLTLSPLTVVHYSWFLWGLFTAAKKAGTITAHPFAEIPLPRPEEVHRQRTREEFNLSIDHYGAILAAASTLDAQTLEVVRLILNTGLRIGEALALQVRHFDFENGTVFVEQQLDPSKSETGNTVKPVKKATEIVRSDSQRSVPLNADALASIRAWLVSTGTIGRPNAFVFAAPRSIRHGAPWLRKSWTSGRWDKVLQIAKAEFGLPELNSKGKPFRPTPHCLRHTFASRMLNAGMTVKDVSLLLGHKDTKITEQIYLWVCGGDLHERAREAAEKAFPTSTVPAPAALRNGWYVDVDGKKKRRTRA